MSDDLVKRLRVNRASLQMWLGEHLLEQYEKERTEAADCIEKLVEENADMQSKVATVRLAAKYAAKIRDDRIERLEAALRAIIDRAEYRMGHHVTDAVCALARKALEGKDG